jgi:ABC-type bacteriocin/lantibiotic exporter with double-glycine peptidase domain
VEQEVNKLTPGQRFWKLLQPDKREITNVYIYALFKGLVNLSVPLGIQAIINLIQGGQVSTSWIVLVIFVILGIAINGVLNIFQLRITENLQQKIYARAAFDFAYRIPRFKMKALNKHYPPELMNRFFDTLTVQKGMSKILVEFSTASLQTFFGLLLLSLYHPLFIMFSFIVAVLAFLIFKFTGKKGLRTSLKESKHKYETAHWLEELARTATTFKLAGKTDLPLRKVDTHVADYLKARESHFQVLVQQYSSLIAFKVIISAGLLIIGGILVIEQQMNIGQFIAAEIIILMIISSIEKLILSLEVIYDVLTSLEKIGSVMDIDIETKGGVDLSHENIENGISIDFSQVHFAYPNSGFKVLKDFNLSIKQGERILLAGDSGSGKTTILNLITGLFDVTDGQICFQGIPGSNIDKESLRTVMGDCLSQQELFNGSIIDNITMGRGEATFENVKWAVNNLGLDDFVRKQPQGFQTILNPEGKTLPQTTVLRLLLARSIVVKPKLLVMEYITDGLRSEEKAKIIDFLTDKSNNWTLVTASKNHYFAQKCDKIVLVEEGRVLKTGTYHDLKDSLDLYN